MLKKIAVINDISGFGKCSLTVAIPIISALKVQACPLVTGVLSNQTCYSSYFMADMTDSMEEIINKWAELGFSFDGIYSGYLAGESQMDIVTHFVDSFKTRGAFFVLDPVMGDNGEAYSNFSDKMLHKMRVLAGKADIITPNATELCFLSGYDYKVAVDRNGLCDVDFIEKAALSLFDKTGADVVVTGVCICEKGENLVCNAICSKGEFMLEKNKKLKGGYSGTGDIMSSVIAAMTARGFELYEAVKTASDFISCSVLDTLNDGTDVNDGVNFEKYLGILTNI